MKLLLTRKSVNPDESDHHRTPLMISSICLYSLPPTHAHPFRKSFFIYTPYQYSPYPLSKPFYSHLVIPRHLVDTLPPPSLFSFFFFHFPIL